MAQQIATGAGNHNGLWAPYLIHSSLIPIQQGAIPIKQGAWCNKSGMKKKSHNNKVTTATFDMSKLFDNAFHLQLLKRTYKNMLDHCDINLSIHMRTRMYKHTHVMIKIMIPMSFS